MKPRIVGNHRLLTDRAKRLRRDSTEPEKRLWGALRNRGVASIRFRRQVALGRYVVDFFSAYPKLVIELDGSQHENQKRYDEARTRYLEACGYSVLRFWNTDVLARLDDVLITIGDKLHSLDSLKDLKIGA